MFQDHPWPALALAGLAGTVFIGIPLGLLLMQLLWKRRHHTLGEEARRMREGALREAEEIREQARREAADEAQRRKKRLDREAAEQRADLDRMERKLTKREGELEKEAQALERRETQLVETERRAERKKREAKARSEELEQRAEEIDRRLEALAGMSAEEARRNIIEELERELQAERAMMIHRSEAEAEEQANRRARRILATAIQKVAVDQVSESTISVVTLESDDVKGRIIGREGRNIRALEATTGCTFIIDDTPGAVVLSCFNPLRREVARIALERLLADGRIHPGRIEQVVEKVREEIDETTQKVGEDTAFELGVHGLDPELLRLVGLLKYRTSYGQNMLEHSIEVARIVAALAAELGLDPEPAKRAGILHDIGKVVEEDHDAPHARLAAELAARHGEPETVCHAIAAHHQEDDAQSTLAVLLQTADAISAARPGVRRESLEKYVKRLQDLEDLALAFPGVSKVYAIQAGREIRIMVDPEKLDDEQTALLARDITRRIEKTLEYPGQIQVTVLREFRSVAHAK